jgi:DNA adenine methylase
MKVPQAFPYQGSKRGLSTSILPYVPNDCNVFIEPFAGSAAMSIAVAARHLAKGFLINDVNKPLAALWKQIIDEPDLLSKQYSTIWHKQHGQPIDYFKEVRAEFNETHRPDLFLFLLARCVKAAVRYNQKGEFNQSADPRRFGMVPTTMRNNLLATSSLLKGKTKVSSLDYAEVCLSAKAQDVVYMDPPYQGVSKERDTRYSSTLAFEHFVNTLRKMTARKLSYIVSYDGRTGGKTYGESLPGDLGLELIELDAGRSSQATLLGRCETTYESLYLSTALRQRLKINVAKAEFQPLLV